MEGQSIEPTDMGPETWFATVKHRHNIDLIDGYAGAEFFVVEGDSLLRWVFSDTRIDFDEGFQLLHAVFVVEEFLQRLRRRRCNFALVFFDACEKLCIPPTPTGAKNEWKYRFARSAIVEHLMGVEGLVSKFKSIDDMGFRRYLDDKRPYFVMAHDGGDSEDTRRPLLESLKKLIDIGQNVALINECEFVDSKIFSTVLKTKYTREPVFLKGGPDDETPEEQKEKLSLPEFSSARERLSVAAVARSLKQEHPDGQQEYLHSVFLLQTALLSHLSLLQRCFPLPENAKSGPEFHNFLQRITAISKELLQNNEVSFEDAKNDVCDFLDGRLLLKLILLTPDPVSDAVKETFSKLSSEVHRLSDVTLTFPELTGTETVPIPDAAPEIEHAEDTASVDDSGTEGSATEVASSSYSESSTATLTPRQTTILRFTNPVLDPYLSQVKLPIEVSTQDEENTETDADIQVARETQTWQYAKKTVVAAPVKAAKKPSLGVGRLGKVTQAPTKGQQGDKFEKRAAGKVRRSEQQYCNQMNRYAASLTDSTNGGIDPKLIVVEEKGKKKEKGPENVPEAADKTAKGGKKVIGKKETVLAKGKTTVKETAPKGKTTGKISAAEIIRQNNSAKKAGKEAKLQDLWNNFFRDVKKITDDEDAMARLDTWLKETKKTVKDNSEWPFIQAEGRLYKLQLLQRLWTGYCRRGEQKQGYMVAAVLFDEARTILGSGGLTQKIQTYIQNIFLSLGIAMPPGKPIKTLPDRKLSILFDATWNGKIESPDIKLGMSSEEFQLLHCGPWMDRNMDSAPDPRVPFEPDGWQRKVLDELDGDNSALVVAPTSAGKTFIAFYAMEKVLKENDDGILVYVAPTKALVNQIAAEVISRFKKNYRYAGKFVWAIGTREWTINKPKECQILITVPHVLQSMLMSPTNATSWTPRIKRIIFDEVHSIGNAEDGAIWEQLLLLSPCPIVALSATVGNAEEFSSWLRATQSAQGVNLSMVQHPHRYSDLRKFVYRPKKTQETMFNGLPRTSRFQTLEFGDGMTRIHPIAALVNTRIEMQDDLSLEPKDCLQLYWALSKAQNEKFPISDELDYKKVFGTKGGVIVKKDVVEWEEKLKEVVKAWMKDKTSPFTKVVEILSNEQIAEKKALETKATTGAEGEAETKTTTGAVIEKNAYLYQNTLNLLQSLHNANALPAILFNYSRQKCETICGVLCEQLEVAETKWRETNPKWTSTVKAWEAYMANKNARGSKVQKIAKPEAGQSKNDMMRDAGELEGSYLDRFDPKYPSAEFSFADTRKQGNAELENDINDLIKWGTPPMLVNAFKRGIGVHHSGLNRKYRQAVEMLFRKGYLRVVIATGSLSLGVNMPTRTTVFAGDSLDLTALNYRQASGRAGRRGFDNIGNVVFHGFSEDRINRLISSKLPPLLGHFPIGASLVLRLFILLHSSKESAHAKKTINSLLTQNQLVLGGQAPKEQVLHHLRFSIEYLRKQKLIGSTGTPLNFAGLMSHLYYVEDSAFALHALLISGYLQEVCRDIYEKPEQTCQDLLLVMAHIFGRRKCRPGIKTLPPMPTRMKQILKQQNDDTLKTYTTYVETFAKGYLNSPDNILPFSNVQCGNTEEKSTTGPTARSAFVALSGHTDHFSSIDDLVSSVRLGVLPEGASIPHIPTDDMDLNGYLVDFYKHSDVNKLQAENGIRPNKVWFVLKDFSVVLETIVPGIIAVLKDGPGAYYDLSGGSGDEKGDLEEVEVVSEEVEGEEEEMIKKSEGFGKVLKAFKVLRSTFDEKFKLMWA
ncbi:uncharacterized protein H6S33_003838 [Morchella sextelata]|uniref:uncharacterized protein n=1 Tax=Morchella sextelata TaxID=1174677 RepID=UPI001D046076|nr:uncharacterized protein H6S33_003838 [Morchella sextelata]KAH0606177.1 hypothetical protein H6S33_003838 [Morchella sextelata]